MAVTKQTYTATATWTASQLAGIFRSALIDAGLMTEWFDTFTSGSIENRVLEVTYNGAKTYGKTYYWFQFTTTGAFVSQAAAWNEPGNVPAGTQYLDHFSTVTNATTNHYPLLALIATTTTTLTRYTDAGGRTFFLIRNGSNTAAFTIDKGDTALQSWVNLDIGYHNGLAVVAPFTSSARASITFFSPFRLRRSFQDGAFCRGSTAVASGYLQSCALNSYVVGGNASATSVNPVIVSGTQMAGLFLPAGFNNANAGFAVDFSPPYTGLRIMASHADNLSADFAIVRDGTNLHTIQEVVTLTPAVEVYESIAFANNSSATGEASIMLLARTT
jgi:hypothetical protein